MRVMRSRRLGRLLVGGLVVMAAVAGCAGSGKTLVSQVSPAASPAARSSSPTAAPRPTPAPTPTVAPKPTVQPEEVRTTPLRVELWGDSISDVAAPYIIAAIDKSGQAVTHTRTYGGTAMCDWFSDMRQEVDPANPAGFHPQVAIIQFSGDAFTPCMKDAQGVAYSGSALVNKYQSDSAIAIAIFSKYKIPVYFVSTPISRGQAAMGYVGNTPLGVMFSKLPSQYPADGLVRFTDAAAAVEWHGHYTDTLPCEKGETCTGQWPDGTKTVVVRDALGTHFCPVKEVSIDGSVPKCPVYMPGAFRFAAAIAAPIIRSYELG